MPDLYEQETEDQSSPEMEGNDVEDSVEENKEKRVPPSEETQKRLVNYVREVRKNYESLNKNRNEDLLNIYEAFPSVS